MIFTLCKFPIIKSKQWTRKRRSHPSFSYVLQWWMSEWIQGELSGVRLISYWQNLVCWSTRCRTYHNKTKLQRGKQVLIKVSRCCLATRRWSPSPTDDRENKVWMPWGWLNFIYIKNKHLLQCKVKKFSVLGFEIGNGRGTIQPAESGWRSKLMNFFDKMWMSWPQSDRWYVRMAV